MRVLVLHNKKGDIRSLAVVRAKARDQVRFEPPQGRFLAEVTVPGMKGRNVDADPAAHLRHLHETLSNYRVQRGPGTAAKLVRKRSRKG